MLKILSLFSGIGAFEKALTNLSIPYELVGYCEIDKYASKAYSVIHNVSEDMNLHDVTKIDFLSVEDDVDLITYGFPCQDISNAGKQRGFTDEEGNRTRSGLFFEALRIIEDYRPKFAIAENVKALTSKKFTNEFKTVLDSLDAAGYNNYYQVLNAKDFGMPQNRERVFIISIRKDIDRGFSFPQPIPLDLRLKDLLDDEVDEKFYLTDSTLDKLVIKPTKGDVKQVGYIKKSETGTQHQSNTVYDPESIGRTLTAVDYKSPLMIKEATKKGYTEATPGDSINLAYPTSKNRRGVANTLTTYCNQAVVENTDEDTDDIDDFLSS